MIVGRAADHILQDHRDVVRVFIYAPEEFRIARIMEQYGDDRAAAERNMRRSDEARGAYYRSMSGLEWGDRRNYDLLVNSAIGAGETAKIITEYIQAKEKGDSI